MDSLGNQHSNIESQLIDSLNHFTNILETSPSMMNLPIQNISAYMNEILMYPQSEQVLLASLKCISAFVKNNPRNCFELIDLGIYNKLLRFLNPSDVNPSISLKVSIEVRNIIIRMGSYDKVLQYPKFSYLKYDLFLDKFYQFPLGEQKSIIEFTRNLTSTFIYDYYLPSITQVCPLLTHFDSQIVSDSIQILLNYTQRANFSQLKIVDPTITQKIAISLEVIDDEHLILFLLAVIDKFTQVSYEYAENLIDLPIDFGLIIDRLGSDPRNDVINLILKIIRRIFSFQTFRKSDARNAKLSKFAYFIQPILIKILSLNSSDINLVLDCLSITFDSYFPIDKINSILDSIVYIISSGNKKVKVDSFYKKIVENQRIKEGINQYETNHLTHSIFIPHVINLNTFNDIQKVHSSTFALSEPLQKSILSFLRSMKHPIDQPFINETFMKIVDFCQKMIVFNVTKPIQKSGEQIVRESSPQFVRFTIYNSSRQMLSLCVPECLSLAICESFFNYVNLLPNQENANLNHLPGIAIKQMDVNISLNHLNNSIDLDSLDDMKIAILNHALCFKSNEMLFISRSVNSLISDPHINQMNQLINNRLLTYKFYKIKADGKVYSIYDNLFHILKQTKTNHFEMIEIPKYYSIKIREADFLCRKDVKHHSSIKQIKFDSFHESFIFAYPTLDLQKKAFDYIQKSPITRIETSLQILKEIHRLRPDLKNSDNESAFVNNVIATRLFEKISFTDVNPVTASAFINFPFLFSLKDRLTFLKLTSLSFFHFIFTMANDVYIKSGKPYVPFQTMNLSIDRGTLFNDGLIVFNLLSPGGISFNVKFRGESGTGSGPTQEFFRLFALQLQLNSLDIWLSDKPISEKNSSQNKATESTSTNNNESSSTNNNESTSTNNNESSSTNNNESSSTNNNDDEKQNLHNNSFDEIFADREDESGLFPSPLAVCRPDLFFTLGSLCAKAIEMEITIPLRFSPAFFKLIRGEHIDLEEVSSHYASAINQPVKDGLIGLPFTLPGRPDIELRNGGSLIVTDEGNVDLYIELLRRVLTFDVHKKDGLSEKVEITADEEEISPLTPKSSNAWLQRTMSNTLADNVELSPLSSNNVPSLAAASSSPQVSEGTINSHSKSSNTEENEEESVVEIPVEIENFIEKYSFDTCASMFREGFGRVIPWNSMNIFTAEELCFILAGEDDLSIDSLHNFVDVGNEFDLNSTLIQWLFEIISEELSKFEKKLFVRFITGSDNFGVFGLKSLNPRLSISKSTKGENALPSASTCTHSLKIPEYSSKKLMKEKLLYALYECNETFYS